MTTLKTEDLGIAIYYSSTGFCIGGITRQGSAEEFENNNTLLEAMPLSALEKIAYCEISARCIERRGKIIGTYMEEPIPEYLLMANGDCHKYIGTLPQPLNLTQLLPGQLLLLPGLLYSAS